MTTSRNVYVASLDPMHYSHLSTLRTAECELRENVSLLIGQNGLKNEGMFTLEERRSIVRQIFHVQNEVILASNFDEIIGVLRGAKRIIRGIRSSEDLSELKRLLTFYNVLDLSERLYLMDVPDKYKGVSSTKLKDLVGKRLYKEAEQMAPYEVVMRIRERC